MQVFEGLKSYIINSPRDFGLDVDTLLAEALLGAVGGAVGSFITTPMDVLTIRIMTQQPKSGEGGEGGEAPAGFVDMAKQVWAEGGMAALFTGWQARTLYWAPAIGIFLSCYCSLRQQAIALGAFPVP